MKNAKRLVSLVLACMLLLCLVPSALAEGFGEKDPASYEANLKMMVHSLGQPTYMIEKFNEKYPNIKIELVEVPGSEQQERIMTTVMAGVDVPDLYTARTQFIKALVNGGDRFYKDLYTLGDTADWVGGVEDYVVGVGTDANGGLRALSWQCPVGGVYYRRSLAKEYFGTDDPAEIQKLFASPEAILETAATLKEKSEGKVKLVGDATTDLTYLLVPHAGGYLMGETLNTGEDIQQIFEMVKTFYDNDYCLKIRNDTTALNAAILADEVFAYCLPTWGLNYNIMPVFPDQAGDWAVVEGPYTYTAGGTYIGISNTTEHPEEAYLFIKFIFTDPDFLMAYATDFGDYVSNKETQAAIGALTEEEGAEFNIFQYLSGQNAYAYWNSQLEKGVDSSAFSPYDEYFAGYLASAIVSYATGVQSFDDALSTYKADCQNYAPSITVK